MFNTNPEMFAKTNWYWLTKYYMGFKLNLLMHSALTLCIYFNSIQ